MPSLDTTKIAIIGLGYVGLPLAVEFGKQFDTIGFDIHAERIEQLRAGIDHTKETSADELAAARRLSYTDDLQALRDCNVFIVAVPTPIDEHKRPDLTPLIKASEAIGSILKPGDVVIYESTVYPGCTEEICVPILERTSGLNYATSAASTPTEHRTPNTENFSCGYSPERINPGDKHRRLTTIPKITSGSTPAAADFVDALYRTIITAGTHKAPSLKVAEAAKVIENTQRDANIALINEFALIFHRLGIDTQDVLAAAATKWNFLPFQPGLVGGHCIGVDPYYLIQKAQAVGYYPDILLACRRINDAMGQHVVSAVVKLMIGQGCAIKGSRVLVLGLTFKENCPDLRNTRVVDLVKEFESFGAVVDIYDPWADAVEAKAEYGLDLLPGAPQPGVYDAVVLAVAHDEFKATGSSGVRAWANGRAVLYDIKGVLPKDEVDGRL
ncbi:MAG: nucleotide sugar dehydrogenase [Rhodanobacter sp.]